MRLTGDFLVGVCFQGRDWPYSTWRLGINRNEPLFEMQDDEINLTVQGAMSSGLVDIGSVKAGPRPSIYSD